MHNPMHRAGDLIDDRSFYLAALEGRESSDTLGHSMIARQVAELATTSTGYVNIAVFGPWGAGKSSLFALVERALPKTVGGLGVEAVYFDAWKHAGPDFSVNFLTSLVAKKSVDEREKVARSLFETRKTLSLPFGLARLMWGWRIVVLAVFFILMLGGIPALWTCWEAVRDGLTLDLTGWLTILVGNIRGWLALGLGGTVLLLVGTVAVELTRVTVEETAPSHIVQFTAIFDQLVGEKKKIIVFIDELDRCSPAQLLQTLEGMRTFLGHERVAFVAAFDRDAVAGIVARERKRTLSVEPSDTAYYNTAGEYLDKIFQFQLSLPPQSAHTMRRFAFKTVEGRAGLWRDLRKRSRLQRVVSLLSPAHVRSPRRAKVLLNDYAVNARGHEALVGDSWIDAAEELAVWTTIQTEFPHLAADMVIEPDLPSYLLDFSIDPSRPALRTLVSAYRKGRADLDATAGTKKGVTRRSQHHDLQLYLEQVQTLRAPLPSPQLIWQIRPEVFESFDDPGLLMPLVRAGDSTVSSTLAALNGATAGDIARATRYLAQQTESEFAAQAQSIARLLGELAAHHPAVAVDQGDLLAEVWRRTTSDDDIEWNTARSLDGYAAVLATRLSASELSSIVRRIHAQIPEESDEFLAALIPLVPEAQWKEAVEDLGRIAVASLVDGVQALQALVSREDADPTGWLTKQAVDQVVQAVRVSDPEAPMPVRGDPQATAAAEADFNKRTAAATEQRSVFESRINDLIQPWHLLSARGIGRQWLLRLLRDLETDYAALGAVHDALIARVDSDQSAQDNNMLILRAIATHPRESLSRWPLSVDEPVGEAAELAEPVSRLLALLSGPDAELVIRRLDEIAGVFGEHGSLNDEALVSPPANPDAFSDAEPILEGFTRVVRGFGSGVLLELHSSYLVEHWLSATDADTPGLLDYTSHLQPEEANAIAHRLRDVLSTGAGSVLPYLVLGILASEAQSPAVRGPSLPIDVMRIVKTSSPWPSILPLWVQSGPRVQSLRAVAKVSDAAALAPVIWRTFSQRSTEAANASAWRWLAVHATPVVLRAVASGGVTQDLYAEIAVKVASGTSEPIRQTAFQEYLGLPQGTRSGALAAIDLVAKLADSSFGGPRSGDFKFAAEAALLNVGKLTTAERDGLRKRLRTFDAPLRTAGKQLALAVAKLW